jgi:ornithine carbamoyltransferase
VIRRGIELKDLRNRGVLFEPLKNRVLGMIFENPRPAPASFEAGMIQLGGQAIFLSPVTPNWAVASRSATAHRHVEHARCGDDPYPRPQHPDRIRRQLARAGDQRPVRRVAPCQLLADMQTFLEHRGSIQGKTVAWIGDGNNMCNSYIEAAIQFDFQLRIACPEGYEPIRRFLAKAVTACRSSVTQRKPCGAHLVSTDVWTSMGQEEETAKRLALFARLPGHPRPARPGGARCSSCTACPPTVAKKSASTCSTTPLGRLGPG